MPSPHTSALSLDLSEFARGWRVVVLAVLGVGVNAASSMLYAFGSLVVPLQDAFGWARADITSAVSFLFMGTVVAAQLVAWLNLRFGMRRVTTLSLLALSATYAAMTQMGPSITHLYVMFFVLSVVSMGCLQVTWTHLVNLGFEANRGLALALVLSGTGLAAMGIPPAVSAVVVRWGWQGAFWLLAVLPLVLVLPLVRAWMKEPQAKVVRQVPGAAPSLLAKPGVAFVAALKMPKFWALNIALSMVVAAVVSLVTNTVPLLRDKGLDAASASQVFGSFGVALIVGRITVGYLIDRVWAPAVAAISLGMPALGCFLLYTASVDQSALLVLAIMLIGVGSGAEFDLAAFLVARYFGMRDYGRLFGVHLSLITLASTLGPWAFGALYQKTGSYDAVLAVCGTMFLFGSVMLLPLGRYPVFSTPTHNA